MLILTRHYSENIKLGDDITITILGVSGNQVKLGISAPKDVPIHREEIYQKIQEALGSKEKREDEIPDIEETDILY